MPTLLHSLLNQPAFARIRRNHGLEHASIHVLSARNPQRSIAGHSDAGGFWLFGELSTEEVQQAVNEALARLHAGEHHLAIHPNCGTNLVTSGMFAGLAGALAMSGAGPRRSERLERLPLAGLLATLALLLARPLGTRLQQRVTTTGDPGDLQIIEIRAAQRQGMRAHRVVTRS